LNPDLDFRTRLAASSDVPEYKRANRSLRIIAEGTAVATGNARILGINFSGFVAWWLWRTIYLLKLPRFEKKLRVALDWTLNIFFSKDFVQYLHQRAPVIADASALRPSGQPEPAIHSAAIQPSRLTENVELIRS
jgi:hypothetical protein